MAAFPLVPIACRPSPEEFRFPWTSTVSPTTSVASSSSPGSRTSPNVPRIWRPCPDPDKDVVNNSSRTSSPPEEKRQELKIGVKASTDIPVMTVAGPFQTFLPLGINVSDDPSPERFIKVACKDGTLLAVDAMAGPVAWMTYVLPARDRHEQNIEAVRDTRGLVYFRVTKEIRRGEQLFVWYSDELALECGIPALSPANIKGDQQYMCTGCKQCFLYPNCLKAHIRFLCQKHGVQSMSTSFTGCDMRTLGHLGLARYLLQQQLCQSNPFLSHAVSDLPQLATGSLSALQTRMDKLTPPLHTSSPNDKRHIDSKPRTLMHENMSYPVHVSSISNLVSSGGNTSPSRPSPYGLMDQQSWLSTYSYLCGKYPFQKMSPSQYWALYNNGMPESVSGHDIPSLSRQPGSPDSRGSERVDMTKMERPLENSDREGDSAVSVPGYGYPVDMSKEPIDMLPKSLYMNKAFKGHLCIYCGKLYSRKYGLKIHLRTHTGYKPLKCKVCSRPFGDPSNLNKHIRLHAEGDTPYRCEYCGKVLVRRRDLERHIKSRHPLECRTRDVTNEHEHSLEESDVIVDIESCEDEAGHDGIMSSSDSECPS